LTAAVAAQRDLAAKEKTDKQAATKAAKATAASRGKGKAKDVVSCDLPGPDLTHLDDSAGEEEAGLLPSTAPPRLEDPSTAKRNSWEDPRLRCSSHGGRKSENQAVTVTQK
jgi:hypothetical protein